MTAGHVMIDVIYTLPGGLATGGISHPQKDAGDELDENEIPEWDPREFYDKFDEENPPEDSFLLKVFKRHEGKSYEVVAKNEIIKTKAKL